jgi:hypothetical protein
MSKAELMKKINKDKKKLRLKNVVKFGEGEPGLILRQKLKIRKK